jgi:hypothetical protein
MYSFVMDSIIKYYRQGKKDFKFSMKNIFVSGGLNNLLAIISKNYLNKFYPVSYSLTCQFLKHLFYLSDTVLGMVKKKRASVLLWDLFWGEGEKNQSLSV